MWAFVLMVAGLVILYLPLPKNFLLLENVRTEHGGQIGAVVVVSTVLWTVQASLAIYAGFTSWLDDLRQRRATIRYLETLSDEERFVLEYAVKQARQTLACENTWDICSLVDKGLLVRGSDLGPGHSIKPCTIPPFVWKRLLKKFRHQSMVRAKSSATSESAAVNVL